MSDFQLTPTDAAVVLGALDKRIEGLSEDVYQMDDQSGNEYDTRALRLELAAASEVRSRIAAWAREVGVDG